MFLCEFCFVLAPSEASVVCSAVCSDWLLRFVEMIKITGRIAGRLRFDYIVCQFRYWLLRLFLPLLLATGR